MVKVSIKLAALAVILTSLLCVGVSAQSSNDIWNDEWWGDRGPNVTYYWDDWASLLGDNPYNVEPDLILPAGGGAGLAVVKVEDPGADLIEGPLPGFGSKTYFWDLGPGGTMDIDVDVNHNGMVFWVQVTYHEGIAVEPVVDVPGGSRMLLLPGKYELRQVIEDTSLPGDSEPQRWVTYMSLWRLDPGVPFGGIKITADEDMGAIIDGVIIDARILPEPTAVVLGVLGNCVLIGWLRRRRQ